MNSIESFMLFIVVLLVYVMGGVTVNKAIDAKSIAAATDRCVVGNAKLTKIYTDGSFKCDNGLEGKVKP